jgi:uncharacterized protein (TIGR02217 family)
MTFYDIPLPPCIAAGSEGVIMARVEIARAPSGNEQRTARSSWRPRRYNLSYNIRRMADLYDVIEQFEVMNGPEHSFPLLDRLDDRSCAPTVAPTMLDANIGTGDDATDDFQLRKGYTRGAQTVYRTITLPVSGTVLIAVAGTLKTVTTHYTVDHATGIVTFTAGNIPTAGQAITAGFKFRVKVRFDANDLSQAYEGYRASGVASVPLIEVLD